VLGVGRGGPVGPGSVEAGHIDATGATAPAAAGTDPPAGRIRGDGRTARPAARLGERDAWTALAAVDGLGPVTFGALLGAFGSARGILAVAATRRGLVRLVTAAAEGGLRMPDDVARGVAEARAGWPALAARMAAVGLVAVKIGRAHV
jgi:hypothetical protein